eukprot:5451805-Amphidinium_carterae.1
MQLFCSDAKERENQKGLPKSAKDFGIVEFFGYAIVMRPQALRALGDGHPSLGEASAIWGQAEHPENIYQVACTRATNKASEDAFSC